MCATGAPLVAPLPSTTPRHAPSARPVSGFLAGKVVASTCAKWQAGDLFGAFLPFHTLQVCTGAQLAKTSMWNLTPYITEAEINLGVGVLGMPGATAYGGLIDVLRPAPAPAAGTKPETIWVSAASGAVGSLVGQIAKTRYGCRVVGSVGSAEKGRLCVDKFGFDEFLNYKEHAGVEALSAAVKAACPDGVNMYFENVGGAHFEAAMKNLAVGGRIAVCGAISQYNDGVPMPSPINIMQMIYTGQRIEGFVCSAWLKVRWLASASSIRTPAYKHNPNPTLPFHLNPAFLLTLPPTNRPPNLKGEKGNFLPDMAAWLKDGSLKVEETHFRGGLSKWVDAFVSLFTGDHTGKVVVWV